MTITQSVEVTESREITLKVPREVPIGLTNVIVRFPIKETPAEGKWVNPLLGLAKEMGSTLTVERFLEMRQEEIVLESENDRRLWADK